MSQDLISYTDDGKTLEYVPSRITTITIISSCTTIYGKSSGDYAFRDAKNDIVEVIFPGDSKLVTISPYAFYNCTRLSKIDISVCSALETIDSYAFNSCSSLTTINFPSVLTTINQRAFSSSGLTSVSIPKSTTTIGSYAFSSCKSLSSFSFEKGSLISSLPDHMLAYCDKIKSFEIPANLQSLRGDAFDSCWFIESFTVDSDNKYITVHEGKAVLSSNDENLDMFAIGLKGSFTVPSSVKVIKGMSFMGASINYITFSDQLNTIEIYAFAYSQIKKFNFPNSLRTIGDSAFRGCTQLATVVFTEGIEEIGSNALRSCTNLQTVVFPSSLKKLNGGVFTDCPDDISITFDETSNLKFDMTNYWIINKDATFLTQCLSENTNYIINKTFKTIGSSAFYQRTTLTTLEFEKDSALEEIESQAFALCYNLQTIKFPQSLTSIQSQAFDNCYKLSSIDFSQCSSLKTIGSSAFVNCSAAAYISFYSSTQSENQRFLLSDTETNISSKAFYNCTKATEVTLPSNTHNIAESAFQYCTSLSQISIPDSCKSIGQYAFSNCSSLEICIFEESSSIESISSYMFHSCTQLSQIVFPSNLKNIESYSFGYTGFENFTSPSTVETIERYAFEGCTSLKVFTIPQGNLTEIGEYVFSGCTLFEKIINNNPDSFSIWNGALFNKEKTEFIILPQNSKVIYFSLPETLRTLRACSLENVASLEYVFIPTNLTEIKAYAFRNCTNLRSINIPKNITIGEDVFEGCNKLQCGLSIENPSTDYLNELVTKSKLPKRCIKQCEYICTCQSSIVPFKYYSVLISLIMSHN